VKVSFYFPEEESWESREMYLQGLGMPLPNVITEFHFFISLLLPKRRPAQAME